MIMVLIMNPECESVLKLEVTHQILKETREDSLVIAYNYPLISA